jgi:hypothetical protein
MFKFYIFKLNVQMLIRNPKRYIKMRKYIKNMPKTNEDLLKRLNDYDQYGTQLWEGK